MGLNMNKQTDEKESPHEAKVAGHTLPMSIFL